MFLGTAGLVPLGMALVSYVFPRQRVYRITIPLMAVLLIASALWLHLNLDGDPVTFHFHSLDPWLFLLDLSVMVYFLYVAFKRNNALLGLLVFLQLVNLVYLELVLRPDTGTVPSLVIDRLGVVMYLVIAVVGSLISLFAIRYMEEYEEHVANPRLNQFFLWFLSFSGIMSLLVFANNLLWLYLFWELTTLCSFKLIGHDDTEEARAKALLALLLNSVGGLAMMVGLVLLARTFGGKALSLISLVNSDLSFTSGIFLLALAFFLLAGFTKAAQFPFQSWLLGAMVAPTPVSALLHSSTMVKAGVYLVLRLAPAYSGVLLSSVVCLFGVFTFFAASLLAVREDNAKRVLALSTVANLGLMIACAGLNTPLALAAAVLLIVFHAVSKALLFMGVGAIEHQLGSRNIESMEGIADTLPAMSLLMTIGVMSMFLPPFGMLFAKWAALEAALREPALLFLFVAGSALTTLFWTKWLGRMISTLPGSRRQKMYLPGHYAISLGPLALGALLLSLNQGALAKTLVAPALVNWYPPAIQPLNGDVAVYAWTGFFNPEILTGHSRFFEGLFPLGLMFAVFVVMLVVPVLLVPHEKTYAPVYLCGENDPKADDRFHGPFESPVPVQLGGYYFAGVLKDRIIYWLNLIACAIIGLMLGVTAI